MRRDLSGTQVLRACSRALPAGLALVAAASFGSCTVAQKAGVASSYLIVEAMEASAGTEAAHLSTVLDSDVITAGGYVQDNGQVTLRLAMKDPGSVNSPTAPSTANFITISRYHVRYYRADRADRLSTPGVEVPYAFDGGLGITVGDASTKAGFTLVRIQAKLEAPLKSLAGLGGALAISTIAEVTFYGMDQAGREVSVKAQISVNFADWADPATSGGD
jgi:hypothetical protein